MYCFLFSTGPAEGEEESFTHQLRGVIPRAFEYLFSLINREQEKVCVVRMLWLVDVNSKGYSVQWGRCRHSPETNSLICTPTYITALALIFYSQMSDFENTENTAVTQFNCN